MKFYLRTFLIPGIFLLSLFPKNLLSQELIDPLLLFKPKTQLLLNISANRYSKAQIENQGANWLNSRNAFGGSIGIGFSQVLFSNFSVILGGELTAIGYNFNYDFISGVQHPEITEDEHYLNVYDYFTYTSWKLGFSYAFNTKVLGEKFQPTVSIGMKYNRLSPYEISGSSGFITDLSNESLDIFNIIYTNFYDNVLEDLHFVSYYLKLGLLKQQKKFNSMQFNVLYHYSSEKIGKGIYQFSNLEEASEGTLEFNSNYIGVEFVYGFTFFKPKKPKE